MGRQTGPNHGRPTEEGLLNQLKRERAATAVFLIQAVSATVLSPSSFDFSSCLLLLLPARFWKKQNLHRNLCGFFCGKRGRMESESDAFSSPLNFFSLPLHPGRSAPPLLRCAMPRHRSFLMFSQKRRKNARRGGKKLNFAFSLPFPPSCLPLPLPLFEEMAGIRFDSFSPRFFFLFPPSPTRVKVLLGMGA